MIWIAALVAGAFVFVAGISLGQQFPSHWVEGGPWRRPNSEERFEPPVAVGRATRRVGSSTTNLGWEHLLFELNQIGDSATAPEPFKSRVRYRRNWRFWVRTNPDHSPREFDRTYLEERIRELEKLTRMENR